MTARVLSVDRYAPSRADGDGGAEAYDAERYPGPGLSTRARIPGTGSPVGTSTLFATGVRRSPRTKGRFSRSHRLDRPHDCGGVLEVGPRASGRRAPGYTVEQMAPSRSTTASRSAGWDDASARVDCCRPRTHSPGMVVHNSPPGQGWRRTPPTGRRSTGRSGGICGNRAPFAQRCSA